MHRYLALAAVVVTLLTPQTTRAQNALVLSGGGSRGLAHIGVLLATDSLQRDHDIVVGVSMGSIVGALYAAGYSAADIARIAQAQDWRDLFKHMPLVLGSGRDVRLPSFHFGVELGRFEFSRGFLPDWRVNRTLVRLLFDADARARGDFDRLPRRYRALGALQENGDPVVLRTDLPRAVRVSIAEPGLISPVLWDERALIDGGIADYMPVALARALGATRVTAVDVMRPLAKLGKDPLSALRHAIVVLVMRARADTTPPDYLIVPDLDPNQAGFSYPDDIEPLIRTGAEAALRVLPVGTIDQPHARAAQPAPASFTQLVIETGDSSLAQLGRALFRGVAPAPYETAPVFTAVDRLYASGFTESVFPRVDSLGRLIVHIDPRPSGSLDVAPGYDNDRGGRIWAALQRRVSSAGAPLEFELAGSVTGTEKWGTLSLRRAFLRFAPVVFGAGGYWRHERSTNDVARTGGWAGLERRHIYPDHVLTASFHYENVDIEEAASGTSFGPLLRLSAADPARIVGVPWAIEAEQRWGDFEYAQAALRGSLRHEGGRLKLAAVFDAAITERAAPPDVWPALGDDHTMPGLRWGEERGRARVAGGFDAAYPVFLGGHVRLRARAGAAPESLSAFDDSHAWIVGAELGGIWPLPIGAVFLGAGFNTRGRSRFDVSLGPLF